MKSLMASSNVPFGAPADEAGQAAKEEERSAPTWWNSYADITNMRYYIDWLMTPNLIYIDRNTLDLSQGNPVLKLKPQDPNLVSNVNCDFQAVNGETISCFGGDDDTSSSSSPSSNSGNFRGRK